MCGIAGYYGQGTHEVLQKMNAAIAYRGPDSDGFFVEGSVGLTHRRLSIIDLSPLGHQPMANEDKNIWIVFNGEIYNFEALQKELKDGHTFVSKTDTEVIIHLYEEIGEEVFSKLEGMFAIALYDTKKNKLFLARDRMGKKPLYWAHMNGTLIFGSELKTILAHPLCTKELNIEALNKYLQYEYVPTPHTLFKDISKLKPAEYLTFDGKTIETKPFWHITFTPSHQSTFEEGKKTLDIALEKAVQERLVSDVPLGIFLSGGLDSSTIAYYAQKNSAQKIKTFSIGFEEASFDESSYAREVAKHLGTDHYEHILKGEECLTIIPELYSLLDEPLADASLIPTYLLSTFTRSKVTVALGGDGGDELFCGYDTFIAHKMARLYERLPYFVRAGVLKIVHALPTSFRNISFDFKLKKFSSGFEGSSAHRNQRWLGTFGDEYRRKVLQPAFIRDEVFDDIDKGLEELHTYEKEDYYNDFIYTYQRMYMMDDILMKVDRASMYTSLEVRAPFLGREVVELANHMPINWKLHGMTTKYILKKLMEEKLPYDIIYRKKKGFGIPLAEWLNGPLAPLVSELLGKEVLEKQGLFNTQFIEQLIEEHRSKKKDNRKMLWTLMVFQMWYNKYAINE